MEQRRLLVPLLLLFLLSFILQNALSEIPKTMTYQGVLTDAGGTPVADGGYDLAFRLYIAESGGTAKWQETQLSVPVTNGVFSVLLGEMNPLNLPFDQQYWLGVVVNGGAELVPRVKLASSPYSLNSQSVVDNAITDSKIANGYVVRSINGKTDNVTLAEGANVTITPSSNTLTISSAFDGWKLTGNAGTTAGTHFLGTTDAQGLELRVNNARILGLETGFDYYGFITANVVAGYSGNYVAENIWGGTIAGGGNNHVSGGIPFINRVTARYGSIGGGYRNTASGPNATVGGGTGNTASGESSTISGGSGHTASNHYSTIGGGNGNTASGMNSKVGGGYNNTASGSSSVVSGGSYNIASKKYSAVPGGHYSEANGEYSFAAGHRAKANHDGCFVWADSTDSDVTSGNADQFTIRANGGTRVLCNGGYTALYVETNGTKRAGHFRITNPSNTNNSVSASTQGSGDALEGYTTGSGNAVYGRTDGAGWAGYFDGNGESSKGVYITAPSGSVGLEVAGGTKSAVVKTSQGVRALYSEEATEIWFTDYGFGRLENGRVAIQIDPLFGETVNLDKPYHVFVQLNDPDCQGVAVVNKTAIGFDVVELRKGRSSAEFSYRIVAKRRGFEDERLEHRETADNDPNL